METRVLIQSAQKTLCSLYPTPVMIHIKLEQDWPTDLRDILHYKYMGNIFYHSRANNSKVHHPIWPEIELVRDFMTILVTCKFEEDLINK